MQNGLVANIEEGNPHPPAIKGSNGKSQLCSMLFSTQTFIIHGGFSLFPNVFFSHVPILSVGDFAAQWPCWRIFSCSCATLAGTFSPWSIWAKLKVSSAEPSTKRHPWGTHLELVYGRNYRKPWFLSSNRLSCTFSIIFPPIHWHQVVEFRWMARLIGQQFRGLPAVVWEVNWISSVVEEWRRGMAFYPIVAEKDQVVPEAIERITKQCHINIFLHNMLLFVLCYFL